MIINSDSLKSKLKNKSNEINTSSDVLLKMLTYVDDINEINKYGICWCLVIL